MLNTISTLLHTYGIFSLQEIKSKIENLLKILHIFKQA